MIDAYLIYNPDSQTSLDKVNVCLESAKKFNINVILVPGVYNDIIGTLESTGMRLPVEKELRDKSFLNEYMGPLIGQIGCTLSHHKLWNIISQRTTPCLVLEHDAEILQDIEPLLSQLDDCIHLDGARKFDDYFSFKNNTNEVLILEKPNKRLINSFVWNINWLRGTHGYLLSPKGASKLLQWAKKYFILPADWSLNNNAINLQYYTGKAVGLQESALADSDTFAQVDKFDYRDLQGFFIHIQKIDKYMIGNNDEIIEVDTIQNARRKCALYLMSTSHTFDYDKVYDIAMSEFNLDQIKNSLDII